MKFAEVGRALGVVCCIMAASPNSAVSEPAIEPRDLEGEWKLVTTRGQVGLCAIGSDTGTRKPGRVTMRHDRVRFEPADDGSWNIMRFRLDGTVARPGRRWTAKVQPDGSVVSEHESHAQCEGTPRQYQLELQGKLKAKKRRLRIELRGTDVVCPEMGCSFKVTHIFTRALEGSRK